MGKMYINNPWSGKVKFFEIVVKWNKKPKSIALQFNDSKYNFSRIKQIKLYNGEFDPGSGRTLAACLTHASRTRIG